MGKKYYHPPSGWDATVDELPPGWLNRKAGGGSGLGDWLLILVLAGGLGLIVWFGLSRLKPAQPKNAPSPTPALATETPDGMLLESAGGISAHPTRTPLVWPTIGVLRLTVTPGPALTPTASAEAASNSSSGSPTPAASPTYVLGPTSTASPAPTQTPRVVYVPSGGGGEPGPTQVIYLTAPPAATNPPLPTYTPYPTYTPPVATATASPSPTARPTCEPAPSTSANTAPPAAWTIYLPIITAPGDTLSDCTIWTLQR